MSLTSQDVKMVEFLEESNAIEDVYGVKWLQQAIDAFEFLLKQEELTDMVIKKAHFFLMIDLLPSSEVGYYRQQAVYIGGREATNYQLINTEMDQWLENANGVRYVANNSPSTVEEFIKNSHIWFEKIHPFIDGNGRIGRMILNWQRVKAGLPILVIRESEKQNYYDWFKNAR